MRPVIKRRRIDPRYFLHESVEEIKLSQTQQATMDTDDDGDIDTKDLATLRKGEEGKKEHEKSAKGADKDPQTKGTQELLLGDKSLYEKIRGAIEEVFDEYLKEEKIVTKWFPSVNRSVPVHVDAAGKITKLAKPRALYTPSGASPWYTEAEIPLLQGDIKRKNIERGAPHVEKALSDVERASAVKQLEENK